MAYLDDAIEENPTTYVEKREGMTIFHLLGRTVGTGKLYQASYGLGKGYGRLHEISFKETYDYFFTKKTSGNEENIKKTKYYRKLEQKFRKKNIEEMPDKAKEQYFRTKEKELIGEALLQTQTSPI